LLDRLTHHTDVTVLEGKSYRVRESEQENAERKQRRRHKSTSLKDGILLPHPNFVPFFSETEVTDYHVGKRTALEPLQLLHLMLLSRGVSIAPRGLMCISTPMDEQDIDHTVSVFRDALGELASA